MLDLKGVLIDFGDTLAYIDKERNRKYEGALFSIVKKYGYQKSLDEFRSSLGKTYWNSTKGEIRNFQEFWKVFLKSLGVSSGVALTRELEEVRRRDYNSIFKLYERAVLVLSSLKKKYKLALVSNCAVGLSDVLQALKLASFFECTILSYKVGVRKPDCRIYVEALRCLKLEPVTCIFVSDEITDLEGARELGLKTLLVRQGPHTTHEAKDPNFKPDFECNNISEITKFI